LVLESAYAFWLYLFGVMTFWGGLSSQSSNSQLSHFIYCMINVVMIFVGVFLSCALIFPLQFYRGGWVEL
jgi:hypothetical protein